MNALLTRMMCGCAVLVAIVGCGSDDSSSDSRFAALDRAIQAELAKTGTPGVAVAIVERGEVTYAKGFGKKDASGISSVEPTTLFRIGSTTKPLTTIAVLQAVQAGLVSLDDPVTAQVPGFHLTMTPEAPPNIKIRHLLSHSSGLADLGDITNAPPSEQSDSALESYLTGRFADLDYAGAPAGAVWAYANPNFMLAGLVAEKATQTPYRQLMHEKVFAPLGMNRTYFLPAEVIADGDYAVGSNCKDATDARCFDTSIPEVVEPDTYDNPWARPAGHAWSSVLDLAEFARFLLHGNTAVLSDDLRNQMRSPQISTRQAGDYISWGYGLMIAQGMSGFKGFYSIEVLDHGGDVAGYASTFHCIPSMDFCFIALSNNNGAHFEESFVTAFEGLPNHPAPSSPPDLNPDPSRFDAYAGAYNDPILGEIDVASTDGKLTIQIPSFDADGTPYSKTLTAASLDNFVAEAGGMQYPLTFVPDANGVYRYVVVRPYIAARD